MASRIFRLGLGSLILSQLIPSSSHAERRSFSRRYNAQIVTEQGTYNVPVDVRNGEVTSVRWPRGKKLDLRGADLNDGTAYGRDLYGDRIKVSIDDPSYDQERIEGRSQIQWSDRE
jgi:hypothetical protein